MFIDFKILFVQLITKLYLSPVSNPEITGFLSIFSVSELELVRKLSLNYQFLFDKLIYFT